MRPRYRRFVSDAFGARAKALGWTPKEGRGRGHAAPARPRSSRSSRTRATSRRSWPRRARSRRRGSRTAGPSTRSSWSEVLDVAARHGDMELFQAYLARGAQGDGPAGARTRSSRRARAVPRPVRRPGRPERDARRPSSTRARRSASSARWRRTARRAPRRGRSSRRTSTGSSRGCRASRRPVSRCSPPGFSDAGRRAEARRSSGTRRRSTWAGPRYLAQSLEQIQLRAALKAAQQESVNDFLCHYEPRPTLDLKPQSGM